MHADIVNSGTFKCSRVVFRPKEGGINEEKPAIGGELDNLIHLQHTNIVGILVEPERLLKGVVSDYLLFLHFYIR